MASSMSHLRAFTSNFRPALASGSTALGAGGSSTTVTPGRLRSRVVQHFCDSVVPRDYALLPAPAESHAMARQQCAPHRRSPRPCSSTYMARSNHLPPPWLPVGVGVSEGTPRRILSI
jgi:hypothetical protein